MGFRLSLSKTGLTEKLKEVCDNEEITHRTSLKVIWNAFAYVISLPKDLIILNCAGVPEAVISIYLSLFSTLST